LFSRQIITYYTGLTMSKKNKLFSSEKLEVRRSIIHGWGVFAKEPIEMGELLQECHGLIISGEDYEKSKTISGIACNSFRVSENLYMIPYGFGAIYNSHSNQNIIATFDTKSCIMSFYALKEIRENQELFLDYESARIKLLDQNISLETYQSDK